MKLKIFGLLMVGALVTLSGCRSWEDQYKESTANSAAPFAAPLTAWSETGLASNVPRSTDKPLVFIADGSKAPGKNYPNHYFAVIAPNATGEPAKFTLQNSMPSVYLDVGMAYMGGRWPRANMRWAQGSTSSTHIGCQVIVDSSGDRNKDIMRMFLLYPQWPQVLHVQLTNDAGVPIGNPIQVDATAASGIDDDLYVEITKVPATANGVVTPFGPAHVNAASQSVKDAAAKLRKIGADAGIPHP